MLPQGRPARARTARRVEEARPPQRPARRRRRGARACASCRLAPSRRHHHRPCRRASCRRRRVRTRSTPTRSLLQRCRAAAQPSVSPAPRARGAARRSGRAVGPQRTVHRRQSTRQTPHAAARPSGERTGCWRARATALPLRTSVPDFGGTAGAGNALFWMALPPGRRVTLRRRDRTRRWPSSTYGGSLCPPIAPIPGLPLLMTSHSTHSPWHSTKRAGLSYGLVGGSRGCAADTPMMTAVGSAVDQGPSQITTRLRVLSCMGAL